jgi:hypothetical protein
MKKSLFVLFALCILNVVAKAAPGDTTWVHANNFQLTGYGNYDSTVYFPHSVTYRRIYMIFTLGKYTCPGYTYGTGPVPWCGDWDYTVQNYLVKPGGEQYELGRFITPYANGAAPRTPYTWTQHYVYDVTDYSAKLQDSCKISLRFSGYSGGFTADIKFALIEGTPDRNVLDIKHLWGGSWAYGDTTHSDSNDINVHFPALSLTAPSGTASTDMKFTVTGHGSDANYCNEFCAHNYQVLLNGTSVGTQTIWRDNCGSNELYPQSGTWLYQRANWCPGAIVYSRHNTLPGITGGSSFNTSILFDHYVSNGGASYTAEGTLIYYGPMNKTVDATLEDVIAPTTDENHFRENPICGKPTIHVKNTGANAISSMDFNYGIVGRSTATYSWTGTLNSLDETDIVLPELADLNSVAGLSGTLNFMATIVNVNGAPDADNTNNTMQTTFTPGQLLPTTFKIQFKTNNEPIATGSTISETSWVIYDMSGAIVASRVNSQISSSYIDTISLAPGCYKLAIYDSSCDGLDWWVNHTSGSTITGGSFTVKKLSNATIALHGYPTGGYPNDFGCGYTAYFYTNWPTGVTELETTSTGMETFPNPAQNVVNIDFIGLQSVDGTIRVFDALGRVVIEQKCTDAHLAISTTTLTNGVYTIQYIDGRNTANKLLSRVIIAK